MDDLLQQTAQPPSTSPNTPMKQACLTDQRPLFPIYLLPSIPFRRHRTSASTSTPTTTSPPSDTSSPPNPPDHPPTLTRLHPTTLKCTTCSTDIAYATQIVSKGFTGRHGRAFLVAGPPSQPPSPSMRFHIPDFKTPIANARTRPQTLVNTLLGGSVNRELLTGRHVVADVTCKVCGTVVGWKYVDAKEPGQRYKIGKFILEKTLVSRCVAWGDVDEETGEGRGQGGVMEDLMGMGRPDGDVDVDVDVDRSKGIATVEFDLEDEDECEDLFAGVWDAELVAKRRRWKMRLRRKGVVGSLD